MELHPGKPGNMNLRSVFENKKVFLTGHTGFKGSWLLCWLHQLGAVVKGYALAPEQPHGLYSLVDGQNLCSSSVYADIRDKEQVKKELLSFAPDYVFHLAAQPLVIASYTNPVYTHEVNAIGTANVLDALRYLEKPCVAVMITTDKVYFNDESGRPYQETDRLGGYDPYSASKAAAEILIASYRSSYFSPEQYAIHQKSVAAARAGNVIGGGDWAENRIVPDIVRALSTNQDVVVRNPAAVRPWQHVLEPLGGYLLLAAAQTGNPAAFADAFNFGPLPADNLTVEEVVKLALDQWGSGRIQKATQTTGLHEAGLLRLDITKAQQQLHWQPTYDAAAAIAATIEWYKQYNTNPAGIVDFTFKQISEFPANEF